MSKDELDQFVADAIAEDREWEAKASPSSRYQPRVLARFEGGKIITRRPFRYKGHWCVRNCGIGRLIKPMRETNGWIVFQLDYGRMP